MKFTIPFFLYLKIDLNFRDFSSYYETNGISSYVFRKNPAEITNSVGEIRNISSHCTEKNSSVKFIELFKSFSS